MKNCNKNIFIFDLDGTLVNAYRAIERSLNFTLKKLGYPTVSLMKVRRSVGSGDRLFIENFFKPDDVPRALRIYRTHHKKSLLRYSVLMPFAKTVLRQLRKHNKTVAVASNRPTPFTQVILKKVGIEKYIDYVLCADRAKRIKPHPQMLETILRRFQSAARDAVYIGDMAIDLEAAQRARIDGVFIKGGSGTVGEARHYRGVKVISSLKEILTVYG